MEERTSLGVEAPAVTDNLNLRYTLISHFIVNLRDWIIVTFDYVRE